MEWTTRFADYRNYPNWEKSERLLSGTGGSSSLPKPSGFMAGHWVLRLTTEDNLLHLRGDMERRPRFANLPPSQTLPVRICPNWQSGNCLNHSHSCFKEAEFNLLAPVAQIRMLTFINFKFSLKMMKLNISHSLHFILERSKSQIYTEYVIPMAF